MANLKTISSKSGARFSVAAEHADAFQGLLDDLDAAGYPIKGEQSGGFNPRNIAGTNIPSQHSFGRAIDINWTDNPRGQPGTIPPELARRIAEQRGLTWGGTWKNPDNMHWEAPRSAPVPMQGRGMTTVAGMAPQQQSAIPDASTIVAQLFSGGGSPASAPATPTFGDALRGLSPAEGQQKEPAPQVQQASILPEMPNAMRRPVDLTRLRQVLASRARLGTAGMA